MKKLLAGLILIALAGCSPITAPDEGDECPPDRQEECGVTGPNGAQWGVTGPNG